MLIAHVVFCVAQADSKKALDVLVAQADTVRKMNGCSAFMPFVNPTNSQQICLLHEWQTPEDFASYTASQTFARVGAILRAMMIAPPVSRRFEAALIESVN